MKKYIYLGYVSPSGEASGEVTRQAMWHFGASNERWFSHPDDGRSIYQNVASLNILAHNVINALYDDMISQILGHRKAMLPALLLTEFTLSVLKYVLHHNFYLPCSLNANRFLNILWDNSCFTLYISITLIFKFWC